MSPMLQARGLHVQFGERRVLNDATLSVKAGRWVALVGPNGADEFRIDHTAGAKHARRAGQGRNPVRAGVTLHRRTPLRKPHLQPRRDPARAIADHFLIGGHFS